MRVRSSQLVQMVDEARRPSAWWLGWPVAIVIIIVCNIAGIALGGAVLGHPADTDVRYQYGELFSFGLTLLALFLWVKLKEGRSFTTVGFRPGRGGWKLLLVGFAIGAGMMTAGVLVGLAAGQYTLGGSRHTLSGSAALLALLPLILLLILQGLTEEAMTRG